MQRLFILGTVCVFVLSCGTTKITSLWRNDPISIDGDLQEWEGKMLILEKNMLAGSIQNDESFLYLAFRTSNIDLIRDLGTRGIILWFTPAGKKHKEFGLELPIPARDMNQDSERWREGPDPIALDSILTRRFSVLEQLYILGEDDQRIGSLDLATQNDVKSVLTYENGILGWEFRIPLVADIQHLIAVHDSPVSKIKLGITTPEMKMNDRSQQAMSGGGMSGMGGGGQRGGKRSGGAGRGGIRSGSGMVKRAPMTQSLDLWFRIALAEHP